MGFNFQNIPVNIQAVQAWVGIPSNSPNNPGSVLYQNSDLTNTIYLCNAPGETAAQPNQLPIQPNGSIALPASMSIWVVGLVNGIQPLIVIPGGSSQFLGLTQAQGTLVLPQVQSQGFQTGVTGWRIQANGNAEFNNVIVRGQFTGADFIINQFGQFFYNGAPARGNMLQSAASANGIDPFGNKFYRGAVTYKQGTTDSFVITMADGVAGGAFQYFPPTGNTQGALIMAIVAQTTSDPVTSVSVQPGFNGIDPIFGDSSIARGALFQLNQIPFTLPAQVSANIVAGGDGGRPFMSVGAPETNNQSGHIVILIQGTSTDGTNPGQCTIAQVATSGGAPTPVTKEMVEIQGTQSAYALKLINQSTPPTTATNGCAIYTDSAGFLRSVLNVDSNTYDIGEKQPLAFASGTTITTVSPSFQVLVANFFTIPSSGGSYRFEFTLSYNTLTSAAGVPQIQFATGATVGHLDSNWQTYQDASGNGNFHSQTGVTSMTIFGGPTMAAGLTMIMKGEGMVQFSNGGTLTFQANTTIAADTFKINSCYLRIRPFRG